jgi:PIN domain nuclease of toxin-antitoxin system
MDNVVLDASAVLARIHNESGRQRVDALLDAIEAGTEVQVSISTVNWCEVLTCLGREAVTNASQKLSSLLAGVEVVPFGRTEAELTAQVAERCPSLSLGDRACLALAASRNATAWTTDGIWVKLPVGARLKMLR